MGGRVTIPTRVVGLVFERGRECNYSNEGGLIYSREGGQNFAEGMEGNCSNEGGRVIIRTRKGGQIFKRMSEGIY